MFLEDDLEVLDLLENGFPRRRYNRKNYYEELDNKTFFQRFRLTKPTVLKLVETLEETLEYPDNLLVEYNYAKGQSSRYPPNCFCMVTVWAEATFYKNYPPKLPLQVETVERSRKVIVAMSSRIMSLANRYPIVRGMISYGTIWPTSCIIQQTIAGKTWENYDWIHALRFSLYGGFFTAPTLYAWIRISTVMWPGTSLKSSITKAIVEQFTYGPAALACFFFGMSLMEGKSVIEAQNAVEAKLFSTWKVGACVWPVLQTINFCYVPEKNRVPFVSACSLVWCCFLAYMQQLQIKQKELELIKSSKNV